MHEHKTVGQLQQTLGVMAHHQHFKSTMVRPQTSKFMEQEDYTTWSGQKMKQAPRLISAIIAEVQDFMLGDLPGKTFCFQAMFPDDKYDYEREPSPTV